MEETNNVSKLQEKILEVLRKAPKPLTPQDIAHQVGFRRPHNQAANVNPTLYDLLERNQIERTTNQQGNKPRYSIPATLITAKAAM
jgi:Fe2+ or Zn2+ uptake regulation protein